MADEAGVDETEKERIRLVETDLAQTNDFIKGVLATGAALRGSAVTVWLALLGFGVQQRSTALCLLAVGVPIVFLVADGYHGWLYAEASGHARSLERLVSSYYDMLSRAKDSPNSAARFRARLRAHRHGLFTGFQTHFSVRQLWHARPPFIYRVLYPALAAIALLISVLVGFNVVAKQSPPT